MLLSIIVDDVWIKLIFTVKDDNWLRRPSSKQRQSSKIATLSNKIRKSEEEQVLGSWW